MTDRPVQAAAAKAAAAERGIATVRLSLVVFNSIIYLTMIWPGGLPWLAFTIIAVANLYSVMVVLRPPRFRTALLAATWTALTDAGLIVLWLTATGAASSPFWILWSISIVAIAFRFGPGATRWVTAGYILADVALLTAWGALWPIAPLTAVRLAYIAFFGLLGTNMASSNLDALRRESDLARTGKRLAESEAQLQAILQNAPSFVILADRDGRIQYLNRSVPGRPREEILGSDFTQFVVDEDREAIQQAFQGVLRTGRACAVEARSPNPDGSIAWYEAHLAPVKAGDRDQVLFLANDVTQQRAQAAAAQDAQKQAFQIERLQAQDAFRRQLLNAVAHELNTPLTPLMLQVDILERKGVEDRATGMLRRNLDRLAQLVGDLLEVARLDAGRLHLKKHDVDAAELVHETVETFAPMAQKRDVKIQVAGDGGCTAHGDRARLSQVLYNLVSNAVKYSPPGGKVHIDCRHADDMLRFAVSDQGPGFTNEQLQELFQPFKTIHPSPQGAASTGLGLYIAKELVGAHGGRIWAESDGPGKGSRFLFEVPAA